MINAPVLAFTQTITPDPEPQDQHDTPAYRMPLALTAGDETMAVNGGAHNVKLDVHFTAPVEPFRA